MYQVLEYYIPKFTFLRIFLHSLKQTLRFSIIKTFKPRQEGEKGGLIF